MPGLGDLVGKKAETALKRAGKNGGLLQEVIVSIAGEKVASTVGDKVNQVLEKVGIQKQLDGKILIKLPWMKSVEARTAEVLSIHPEWGKICAHIYDDSIRNETVFCDLDGNEWYKIKKTWKNMKHIALLREDNIIGEVHKKIILIKNPLSFAEPYRYTLTLRGNDLGTLEIRDQKLKAHVRPDFDSWKLIQINSSDFELSDGTGCIVAGVYDVGENNYIFDYSTSVNPELLILTYIATQMREENLRYDRKSLSEKIEDTCDRHGIDLGK